MNWQEGHDASRSPPHFKQPCAQLLPFKESTAKKMIRNFGKAFVGLRTADCAKRVVFSISSLGGFRPALLTSTNFSVMSETSSEIRRSRSQEISDRLGCLNKQQMVV